MSEIDEPASDESGKSFPYEYVKALREENGRYRRQKSEAERERDELKTAGERQVATALKQANERVIRAELKAEAMKAGINDPEDLKLIDAAGLTLNASGEVEGAAAAVSKLKRAKPYLFKGAAGTSGTDTPPRPGDRQARDALKMTREEFKADLAKRGIRLPR